MNFVEHVVEVSDGDGFESLTNFVVHAEEILHAPVVRNLLIQLLVQSGYPFHLAFDVVHVGSSLRLRLIWCLV